MRQDVVDLHNVNRTATQRKAIISN